MSEFKPSTFNPLAWTPNYGVTASWILERLRAYRPDTAFAIFGNGTVVFFNAGEELGEAVATRRLEMATLHRDFKVRRVKDGNYLVTFRGGLGSIIDGELLTRDFNRLAMEAMAQGIYTGERFSISDETSATDLEIVAGLLGRGLMQRDAVEKRIVYFHSSSDR